MAAAAFSDDAYNKNIKDFGDCAGTLVGNWAEERVLRDSCGEGRSVPMRHLRRSGLLKDWTKVPSGGPRAMDNTFERVYGPDAQVPHVPQSKLIGGGEADHFGDRPIAPTVQAEGKVSREGVKARLSRQARLEAAEEATKEEEAVVDAIANERYFISTTGYTFTKPPEAQSFKAEKARKSFKLEILHGAAPERRRALSNAGLEVVGQVHYSNMEAATHQRMALADPRMRSDVKASYAGGVSTFGKHAEFTKHTSHCLLGLNKDEEMDTLERALRTTTNPHRTLGGSQPRGPSFAAIPSLPALKECLHMYIENEWGVPGYVVLRQQLFNRANEEGFVTRADATAVFREELGVSTFDINDDMLGVYLGHLITMKKNEFHVSALLSSLRPPLSLKSRKVVIDAFESMGPVDGAIRLGSWLDKVTDGTIKETVLRAFGAEGQEEAVHGMPVTEPVFMDVLTDLSALTDIQSLLGSSRPGSRS